MNFECTKYEADSTAFDEEMVYASRMDALAVTCVPSSAAEGYGRCSPSMTSGSTRLTRSHRRNVVELEKKKRSSKESRQAKKATQSQHEQIRQREQANNRERDRTESLNTAFSTLRSTVPTQPQDKMSKIHTLRLASQYINFLRMLRDDADNMFAPYINMHGALSPDDIHKAFCAYRVQHDRGHLILNDKQWQLIKPVEHNFFGI